MAVRARAAACEATWDKINNKVAWRMADIIQERRREQGKTTSSSSQPSPSPSPPPASRRHLIPVYGWLMMNSVLREAVTCCVIDARLMGGLAIIIAFWAVTGCYVMFAECLLWAKGRVRIGERKVTVY